MWSQVGEKFDNSLNLMPIIFSRGGRKDTEKGLGLGNLNRFCIQGLTPLGKSQKKGEGKRQDKGQRGPSGMQEKSVSATTTNILFCC